MENLITQMLVKKSLFVANKVFREIIVWLHVDFHIYIQKQHDKLRYQLKRAHENFAF